MDGSTKSAASGNTAVTPHDDGQLVERLAEEYKILQDKIDKIGAFRFTIKGWSITVIIAALFAGSATDSISAPLLVVCLFVVLTLFFFAEKKQTDLSHYFGERAISIEVVISRVLRKSARAAGQSTDFVLLRFVPGIAHHLRRQRPEKRGSPTRWQKLLDADILQDRRRYKLLFRFREGSDTPPRGFAR